MADKKVIFIAFAIEVGRDVNNLTLVHNFNF